MVDTLPLVVGKLSGDEETTPSGGCGAPHVPVERLVGSPQPPTPFQPLANAGPVPSKTTKQATNGTSRRTSIPPPIGRPDHFFDPRSGLTYLRRSSRTCGRRWQLLTVSAQEG